MNSTTTFSQELSKSMQGWWSIVLSAAADEPWRKRGLRIGQKETEQNNGCVIIRGEKYPRYLTRPI